jgi:hypothetical protein
MIFQFTPANGKEMAAKNIGSDYGINKGKAVPVLNYSSCDEVVWKNGSTALCTPRHWTEVSREFHAPAELSNNYSFRYLITNSFQGINPKTLSEESELQSRMHTSDLTIYLQPPAITGHEIIFIQTRYVLPLMRASEQEKM